jgi:hypothetical protein
MLKSRLNEVERNEDHDSDARTLSNQSKKT